MKQTIKALGTSALYGALCLLCLAACTQDDTNLPDGGENTLRVESVQRGEIGGAETRTSSAIPNAYKVGIVRLLNSGIYTRSAAVYSYESATNSWKTTTDITLSGVQANLCAYYASKISTVSETAIPVISARYDTQADIEAAEVGYQVGLTANGKNNAVTVTMQYAIAKMQLVLTKEAELTDEVRLTSVALKHAALPLKAELNIANAANVTYTVTDAANHKPAGTLTYSPEQTGGKNPVVPSDATNTEYTTSAVLIPFLPASDPLKIEVGISITDAGTGKVTTKTVLGEVPAASFNTGTVNKVESGKLYTLNVKLRSRGKDLQIESIYTEDWTDGGSITDNDTSFDTTDPPIGNILIPGWDNQTPTDNGGFEQDPD